MPSNFITLSKAQFEAGLFRIREQLPKGTLGYVKEIEPKGTWEYVYKIYTSKPDIYLWIYSSVSKVTGKTRSKGSDAIRCVLIYKDKEVFKNTKHTKRIISWNGNLKSKITELMSLVDTIPRCPNCSSFMLQRKGKHGIFWGCSNYPNCKGIKNIPKSS